MNELAPYQNTPEALTALTTAYDKAFRSVLKPRPTMKGSDFANRYLMLSAESSLGNAAFSWQNYPYQKEWLDVCTDTTTTKVVLCVVARAGKTTAIKNALVYYAIADISPQLYVLPDIQRAKDFSNSEIDPLIRDTPALRNVIKDRRRRDSGNTRLLKVYPGGRLYLRGAKSPAGLAGFAARCIYLDEVDRYGITVEGDPIAIAEKRASNYGSLRKIIISSTPTITETSPVWREFQESDQRYYYVPCPHCLEAITLEWENLNYKHNPAQPVYTCQLCHTDITEEHKRNMLMHGAWKPHNPDSRVKGYHLNALYSVEWVTLVEEWIFANKYRTSGGIRAFKNLRLALPVSVDDGRTTGYDLEQRLEHYESECPPGVSVITAGVDVQRSPARLEISVWGWGRHEEGWLLDTRVFEGKPDNSHFNELARYVMGTTFKNKKGGGIPIASICVDAGYLPSVVYDFVKTRQGIHDPIGRKWWATIGRAQFPSIIAVTPATSKEHKGLYYKIGSNLVRDIIWSKLQNSTPGPNYLHIPVTLPSPDHTSDRFTDRQVLEQLTNEHPEIDRDNPKGPRKIWKQKGPCEQWDMLQYAFCAFHKCHSTVHHSLDQLAARNQDIEPVPKDPSAPVAPVPAPARRKPGVRLIPAAKRRRF